MTARDASHASHDNLVLIGFRGTGKTVVGRALARHLERAFVDTDEELAREAGCSIAEFFERLGEPAFRKKEREWIERVCATGNQVISVGGGAVLRADNRHTLQAAGRVVWLEATADTITARLRADPTTPDTRPSLTNTDLETEVRMLLDQRLPYYAALADLRIDTSDRTVDHVVDELLALLGRGPTKHGD